MISKVIYGNTTLLDLTQDTVTPEHLESGFTAHDANGESITGTLNPSPDIPQLIFSPMEQSCAGLAAIAYAEIDNEAGGKTLIIGGVSNGV